MSDTVSFPLVANVKRRQCLEVLVKRPVTTGGDLVATIWKHGEDLTLKDTLQIYPGDVIEIRLTNAPEDVVKVISDDEALVTTVPPDDDHKECVVCLDKMRDVVFEPCLHCNVCMSCYKKMRKQECPCCYAQILSAHDLHTWNSQKGWVIYSTAGMYDVNSLLSRLQRHCIEDAQEDDLLRQ